LVSMTTHKRNTTRAIIDEFTHAGLRCLLVETNTELAPIPGWDSCNGVRFEGVNPNITTSWHAEIGGVAMRDHFFIGEGVAVARAQIKRAAEEQRERRDSRERAERDSAAAVELERNRTPEEREAHLDELRRDALARFDARRRA